MIKNARNAWKEFIRFKNGRLNYKCKECKTSYSKLTNESINNFPALHKFCNSDLDKFFLLLRKGIYPYEYIDSQKKFNENTVPPKEASYRELNLAMQTMSMLKKYEKHLT